MTTTISSLGRIEAYYHDRVRELAYLSRYGTAWDFVNGCVLIDWLAALSCTEQHYDPVGLRNIPKFVAFVTEYMPDYADFDFQAAITDFTNLSKSTTKYLPLQLYLSFRNSLVHSFSTLPTGKAAGYVPLTVPRGYSDLARPNCIVMCHRGSAGNRWDGEHLSLVTGDRCRLRSPDFLEDIDDAIARLFDKARTDAALSAEIINRHGTRPPVGLLEVDVIRSGPVR